MSLLPFLGMLACQENVPQEPNRPQFLIVLINGLRSDSAQATVENSLIEAIGRTPHRHYSAMYANSTSKPLSYAALLTGDYPSAIPICGQPGQGQGRKKLWCSSLPKTRHTLPEVFQLYGYETAFFNADVSHLNDIGRGFSEYYTWSTDGALHTKNWSLLNSQLTEWWSQSDKPHMAVIGLDLMSMALKKSSSQAYLNHPMSAAERTQIKKQFPNYLAPPSSHIKWPFLSPSGSAFFQSAYEAEIKTIGSEIQKSLFKLQQSANTNGLWVIVTSLRGVSLGALGGVSHPEQNIAGMSEMLLDRSLRMPLFIWGPPSKLPANDTPVELIDLFPSLAELADIPPPQAIAGRSIFSNEENSSVYAEYGDMLLLREGKWLLSFRQDIHGISSLDPRLTKALINCTPEAIRSQITDQPSTLDVDFPLNAHFGLYNIIEDPEQKQNLIDLEPAAFEHLVKEMLSRRLGEAAPPKESMSFEQVEALNQNGTIHYW